MFKTFLRNLFSGEDVFPFLLIAIYYRNIQIEVENV